MPTAPMHDMSLFANRGRLAFFFSFVSHERGYPTTWHKFRFHNANPMSVQPFSFFCLQIFFIFPSPRSQAENSFCFSLVNHPTKAKSKSPFLDVSSETCAREASLHSPPFCSFAYDLLRRYTVLLGHKFSGEVAKRTNHTRQGKPCNTKANRLVVSIAAGSITLSPYHCQFA
ncbi:unnamed protein product [Periconia digitata]|uniref:Uncharacterized protein n=1 Tax=Periconia digitata TaxID=1303443 RepID=A0A9W4XTW7_9PLEO|nr:unnamed protein product [Periconia digitata]